jgi:hypothetical protein
MNFSNFIYFADCAGYSDYNYFTPFVKIKIGDLGNFITLSCMLPIVHCLTREVLQSDTPSAPATPLPSLNHAPPRNIVAQNTFAAGLPLRRCFVRNGFKQFLGLPIPSRKNLV